MKPYQFLPPLTDEEREALKEDIRTRGVQVPVLFDEAGNILDGHNRADICKELGFEYPKVVKEGLTEDEKHDLVLALNVHRRHLTQEQRQELIGRELQKDPTQSDRVIAKKAGASPTTVGTVRRILENGGQVSNLDTCVGADGKTYTRSRKVPTIDPATEGKSQEHSDNPMIQKAPTIPPEARGKLREHSLSLITAVEGLRGGRRPKAGDKRDRQISRELASMALSRWGT